MNKPDPTRNFIVTDSIMSEKTKLPELDYTALQMNALKGIKTAFSKAPAGRFEALLEFLKQRSGGVPLDAAEVDRRLRTFFEDIVTDITKAPADWDTDRVLSGKAMMDYLAGNKDMGTSQEMPAAPAPQKQPPPKPPVGGGA